MATQFRSRGIIPVRICLLSVCVSPFVGQFVSHSVSLLVSQSVFQSICVPGCLAIIGGGGGGAAIPDCCSETFSESLAKTEFRLAFRLMVGFCCSTM